MKKQEICPSSSFSSSKMIILITEGQILKHGWIGVLYSKTHNVWHQGTFSFRSYESIWTCRETQEFCRLLHERSILKNIQHSGFFHTETIAGSRAWECECEFWVMEQFLRVKREMKKLWKACPNFSCWAGLFKVLLCS